MQYVLYTFDVTVSCPKWKCMQFIKLMLCLLDTVHNGTGSKRTMAQLHQHGWGWLQPNGTQKAWSKYHRPQSDSRCARPTGREHNHGCCYLWEWRANAYSHYGAVQYRASCHLLRHSLQGSHPWTREGSDWRWLTKVRDSLGQCQFPSLQHHQAMVATHNRMLMEFLSPYSPFLNPIEECFSAWRWKVYDRQPHTQMTLLAAMDAACDDVTADAGRGWIRHSKRFFPRCIAREDICCDVDENLWPNRQEHQEVYRLHCNSYSTACTVFPMETVLQYVHISILLFCFFLCALQCCLFLSVSQWHGLSTNYSTNSKSVNVNLVQSLQSISHIH